jgi:hypothetical protein
MNGLRFAIAQVDDHAEAPFMNAQAHRTDEPLRLLSLMGQVGHELLPRHWAVDRRARHAPTLALKEGN